MGVVTSVDCVLTLTIPPLFPVSQQLQGFATDDIYNIPRIRSVETLMGVDGVLSAGFVYKEIVQEIMLQADSLSNDVFDVWWTSMQSAKATYPANGTIKLPSISTKFIQTNGYLTGYTPAPPAQRILQPRAFEITWQTIAPAPV
jgi:hypothetical protein